MKKLRMTMEELIELKPSMDNPIKLVCDDGFYDRNFKEISVVARVTKDTVAIIDSNGSPNFFGATKLCHYPSFKKEKTVKKFYQVAYKSKNKSAKGANWYVMNDLVDENFKNAKGVERLEGYERKLLTDRVIEIEVDDEN